MVRAALSKHQTLNRQTAPRTGRSLAVGDTERVVRGAPSTIGQPVRVDAGALPLDRTSQHAPDTLPETMHLDLIECARRSEWVDSCLEQSLVRVHVADSGDDVLVKQGRLDGDAVSRQRSTHRFGGEVLIQRLGPQPHQQGFQVFLVLQLAKSSGIGE